MTVRCIDIETTGTDPARDAIVEIASVDLQHDNTITNFKQTLVNPGISVPAPTSAVHHLIDADLAGAPLLADAIDQFKGADAYIAHNCAFERSFPREVHGRRHLGLHLQMRATGLAGPAVARQSGAPLPVRLYQSARRRSRETDAAPGALGRHCHGGRFYRPKIDS